ncbi:hypothetical protein PR048_023046 [Dryococelus australis]|uniref:Uncharacterized protein n=1 Tax=Dryococelus australis TaxID=614101 RepID=A0ABQ9GT00_9NEOP|nr:hypothetical protein PR048_023046 [Dryococelus australis]
MQAILNYPAVVLYWYTDLLLVPTYSSEQNSCWWGHGEVVSLLASHQVGIVPGDAVDRRVFSRISCFPSPIIPALFHTHLTSPSSALKTSLLRAAHIFSLTHSCWLRRLMRSHFAVGLVAREQQAHMCQHTSSSALVGTHLLQASRAGEYVAGRPQGDGERRAGILTHRRRRRRGNFLAREAVSDPIHTLQPLVHMVFDPSRRTLAQSSPYNVTPDNQCAANIGIFVHTTLQWAKRRTKRVEDNAFRACRHQRPKDLPTKRKVLTVIRVNFFNVYGATLVERSDCSPPTKANRVQSPAGSLLISASGNRAGRCRWSAVFLGSSLFPHAVFIPALLHPHLASPSSAFKTPLLRAAQIFSMQAWDWVANGRGGAVVNHWNRFREVPGSIPGPALLISVLPPMTYEPRAQEVQHVTRHSRRTTLPNISLHCGAPDIRQNRFLCRMFTAWTYLGKTPGRRSGVSATPAAATAQRLDAPFFSSEASRRHN